MLLCQNCAAPAWRLAPTSRRCRSCARSLCNLRGFPPIRATRSSSAHSRALNLHNLWNGGKHTVEYRFFNGTTHAGEVKTAVQLALLIAIRATNAKASEATGSSMYCVKGESEKTLHGSESGC